MSIMPFLSEITSFSPAIPPLLQFTEPPRENRFDEQNAMIQKAHEEARVVLKGLRSSEMTRTAKSSCVYGLIGGIAGSFLLKNPLPLLLGLSECAPRASAQQKIGNEFQVNTYTNNTLLNPSVASFNNGNFVVTWMSDGQDGSGYGVYGQLFDGNGTKLGSEFQANTYVNISQSYPSVATFSDGNFVMTWQSDGQDGSNGGVYGQLFYGNSTKIGSEFRANNYTTADQNCPSVASFSNGNFVVTWRSWIQDGSVYGVYGQLFDGNGIKIGSEFRANTYTTNHQWEPSVASFSNENFVVTWASYDQDGSRFGVYGQLFNENTIKIGSELQVNTYTNNSQSRPSVTSLSNGNFVVTWQSDGQDGSDKEVYGQLFNGNVTKIGSEFRANNYLTLNQWAPSVASFSNGNFVVAWQSEGQDGSHYGVYGQLFNGNGTKIGSEFRANNYTTLDQNSPSVTSFSNGNFVVTWHSEGQDGSDYGIYGQIFNNFSVSNTISTSTSSITSSVSSSTMSAIGRTRTSLTHSNSRTTVSRTTRPKITSRTTFSTTSDPSNYFSWVWFLLGGIGAIFCFSLTGYFVFKSKVRKKEDEVPAFELGADQGYSKTPNFVTADPDHGYSRTPDFVTADPGHGYSKTPDFVTADPGHGYSKTPDFVTARK